MPYRRPAITLVEGKWFPSVNISIRELFQPLFTLWSEEGETSCHYEMFTTETAFRSAMLHAFRQGRSKIVYIAAHGSEFSIHGFHDEKISRTKIRNALRQVHGTVARGIYFGACLFGTEANARFILSECPRVNWVAGYSGDVDWIDSSAMDLFFLRHFLYPTPGRGHRMPSTFVEKLRYATEQVIADMPNLAFRLGFHVFVRKKGPGGGVIDLIGRELEQ